MENRPSFTGVVATALDLVLAVVASTVAVAAFGPTISSRRGRDFGTMAIALVPTFAQIGIWAPLILLFLRILQGLGLGGDIPQQRLCIQGQAR